MAESSVSEFSESLSIVLKSLLASFSRSRRRALSVRTWTCALMRSIPACISMISAWSDRLSGPWDSPSQPT